MARTNSDWSEELEKRNKAEIEGDHSLIRAVTWKGFKLC